MYINALPDAIRYQTMNEICTRYNFLDIIVYVKYVCVNLRVHPHYKNTDIIKLATYLSIMNVVFVLKVLLLKIKSEVMWCIKLGLILISVFKFLM